MSDNENTVYIFAKGNKGRASFEITNVNGDVLHPPVILEGLVDVGGNILWPVQTDWVAIIKSLEYIRDNRGKSPIPSEPIVFIFTTYENTYHVANHMKGTVKTKFSGFLKEYENLKDALKRKSSPQTEDDVKLYWIPQNFVNKMEDVDRLLKNSKKQRNLKQ